MTFDIPSKEKSIIKVIGVGGGGGNAVKYMYNQGIIGVDFAVCNTDRQALDDNPIPVKINLGPKLTEGRGAGSRPEIGKQACIESIEDIKVFLEDGTKMLFVTAGLGGGTGTGAAPIIAKAAKEMDILTVGIVTLPFSFEGKARELQALKGLEELKKAVDALLVISNNRLMEIFENLKMSQAFNNANEILSTAAKGIAEIITVSGFVNVDFEDVNYVMRDSGVALMGFAEVSGDDRAKEAIEKAINSPLLKDRDIRGAQNILLNISTSAEHEITMHELQEITEYVQEESGLGTNMIWGHCIDNELNDNMRITLIATGFREETHQNVERPQKPEVVPLEPDFEEDDGFVISEGNDYSNTVEFHSNRQSTEPYVKEYTDSRDIDSEGRRYRSSRPKPMDINNYDNPKLIAELERRPAFDRLNINLDDIQEPTKSQKSNQIISIDDDSMPFISENNSYLEVDLD